VPFRASGSQGYDAPCPLLFFLPLFTQVPRETVWKILGSIASVRCYWLILTSYLNRLALRAV
jgi:hypothetical protein